MSETLNGGSVRILWDEDDSAAVTITNTTGAPVAFTVDGAAVSFPYTLSESTTFDTEQSGRYEVSVRRHGIEVANTPDGTRLVNLNNRAQETFAPSPDSAQALLGGLDAHFARVSDLARERCLRGVLVDDMTDAGAWSGGSVAVNADPSDGLRMSTAGADTYAYITTELPMDARHGFLSFEMRGDANLWRVAWGMSCGTEDFTKRFEGTCTTGESVFNGKWRRVSIPVSLAVANGATGADLEDVRVFRFEIHSNSGGATNLDVRDLRWHPYPYPDNAIAGVVMVFDDGYTDHYTEAFRVMEPLGLVGSVGVIPESVGTTGFATLAQLQEMQAAGWEHCGHGTNGLVGVAASGQRTTLRTARNYLTANGMPEGRGFFVYPGGSYDAVTLREAPRFYGAARTVSGLSGETPFVTDVRVVRSYYITKVNPVSVFTADVDKLADRGGLLVLTFHRIVADTTSAPQESISIADFETLCKHIAASGVPTFRPSEVFDLSRCYSG